MSTTATANQSSTASSSPSNLPRQQHPQKHSIYDTAAIKNNWEQLTSLAKAKWGELTERELIRSEGDEQKLTTLVNDHYSIPREEANRQVKSFFAENASS